MRYKLDILTAPSVEPITVAEAKLNSRVVDSDEDTVIARHIAAARRMVEQNLRSRAIINTVFTLTMPCFPWGRIIRLPRATLQSVTSVTYYDEDDVSQTFASSRYNVVTATDALGWIELDDGDSWPTVFPRSDAVTVTFTAGYGASASDVPEDVKCAILMLTDHLYTNRGAIAPSGLAPLPMGVDSLLDNERLYEAVA